MSWRFSFSAKYMSSFPHPATDPSADSAPLDTAPDDTATQPSTAISDYRVELLAALKSITTSWI